MSLRLRPRTAVRGDEMRLKRLRRRNATLRLSQRFFLISLVLVVSVVVAFGGWAGQYFSESVVKGVGATAAGSIESLVSRDLRDVLVEGRVSKAQQQAIDAAFYIASATHTTRLLMLRFRRSDGTLLLEAGNAFEDASPAASEWEAAVAGDMQIAFSDVVVPPLGGLPPSRLPVLRIYVPVTAQSTTAVAELYFTARTIRRLQSEAMTTAWIIASVVGFAALGAIALLVDVTGTTIAAQRQRLARNLRRTRQLLRENVGLQRLSEELRAESLLANERMLAEVGTDIHDGPVQLLTLLILQLPPGANGSTPSKRELAQEALEELRAISAGLVLPQLAEMDLSEAIQAAIVRHENLTGTVVERDIHFPSGASAQLTTRIGAFRVVQEALTNAHRHGADGPVRVEASVYNAWLRLVIANPAPGDVSIQPTLDRVGLRGMQFRVESQGGRLDVAADGAEVRVEAWLPLFLAPQAASSPLRSVR